MDKELVNGGGAAIGLGLIMWVIGRALGGIAVFAPVIAIGGVICLLVGLCKGNKGR